MKTNGNITVYNAYFDQATRQDKLKRTQVGPVFIDYSKGANVVRSGLTNANSVIVYIPFTSKGNYQEPKEFSTKPIDEKSWTLKAGDIIVDGLVDFEGTIKQIREQFDYVYTITNVDKKDFGSFRMRHFEVGGV